MNEYLKYQAEDDAQAVTFILIDQTARAIIGYYSLSCSGFACMRMSCHTLSGGVRTFGKEIYGGDSDGVPPLPIPNREVKPVIADGTAMQCGRVGSRLFSHEGRFRQ